MSQRNRSVLASLFLGAALVMTFASPAGAAGLQTGRFPVLGALDRAWDWLAGFLAPGMDVDSTPRQAVRREKEGTAINPDGRTNPATASSSTTTAQALPTLEGGAK